MEKNRTSTGESKHATSPKPAWMKSAVIIAPGKFEFQNVEVPRPAANQVLVQLEGCGVCGSDLPVWEGRSWFQYPYKAGAPGHEGFGVIAELGSDVSGLRVGDRVAMLSYNAYAEYDVANAGEVVKLPEHLADLPFPGEPLGCSMNIFHRSQVKENDTVAIIGAGFIGNLMIQLCKSAGAKVIAISKRDSSLKMAFESGADYIIKMDNHYQIIEKVNEITNNEGCSRVIEATGKQWPLDLAGEITGIRGRLIIAGFHQDGMRQVNLQNWNWKGIDVINAHERDPRQYVKGMQLAIDAVKENVLNPQPLFTHLYGFEQLNSAFLDMSMAREGYVKGIVKMQW